MKLLYKKLFSYVSYKNTSYSIASLSLLTTLVLNEEIGEKVLFLGVYFSEVFITVFLVDYFDKLNIFIILLSMEIRSLNSFHIFE